MSALSITAEPDTDALSQTTEPPLTRALSRIRALPQTSVSSRTWALSDTRAFSLTSALSYIQQSPSWERLVSAVMNPPAVPAGPQGPGRTAMIRRTGPVAPALPSWRSRYLVVPESTSAPPSMSPLRRSVSMKRAAFLWPRVFLLFRLLISPSFMGLSYFAIR